MNDVPEYFLSMENIPSYKFQGGPNFWMLQYDQIELTKSITFAIFARAQNRKWFIMHHECPQCNYTELQLERRPEDIEEQIRSEMLSFFGEY